MKKLLSVILFLGLAMSMVCRAQSGPRRNIIYVLDCTGSMNGYNGAPDIWEPTKKFLKTELEKEIKAHPDAKITVLPFQEKVLPPIHVDPANFSWSNCETMLDKYVNNLTATNICDSWLAAEGFIDESCENYIVLMTDGHDNIGGTANQDARMEKLAEILRQFCGKYKNTKGMYVELTKSATLPDGIRNVVDVCEDIHVVDASDGIPSFGCVATDRIVINTRDLPIDLEFGFSDSGKYRALVDDGGNEFVKASVKGGIINHGQFTLCVESKFGDDIDRLNKAMGKKEADVDLTVESQDCIIINPEIAITLINAPVRTLDLKGDTVASFGRVKPFLWIKGNEQDTLRWNLKPEFNEQAKNDRSAIQLRIKPTEQIAGMKFLFDGQELGSDSLLLLTPESTGCLELIVPQGAPDGKISFEVYEYGVNELDRINGHRPANYKFNLSGEYSTSMSWLEILTYILVGLILLALILWFAVIKGQKYPTFKKGMITISDPYFATVQVRGYRKVVFTPNPTKSQGFFNRLFTGRILYHPNGAWPVDCELTPSGRYGMRFRCATGRLVSDPSPIWMPNESYKILDSENGNNPAVKLTIQ